MTSADALFTPFTCRGMTIPNRIVMAPMTRSQSPGGVPTEDVKNYYGRRAAADVGLIVTEGTTVDRGGASNDPRVPNFHAPEALDAWGDVVEAVHKTEGAAIAPQLWHVGMVRKPGTGPVPEAVSDSPSGVTHQGKEVQPVPTDSEVADMIAAFAKAAGDASRLGFDAVELHGAHGYLIDQFFWSMMNRRDGKYGGETLTERAAFAAEIIRGSRAAMNDDMPLILRFSQWKQQEYTARLAETPQELEAFVTLLADAGVDIFHCSQRRWWEPEFPEIDGDEGLNLAGWTKKLSGKPTITVGSVGLSSDFIGSFGGEGSKTRPIADIVERVEKGEFDLVAVGRALLQDADWAAKVKDGRHDELRPFDAASLATLS
ncbi:NADH:flavin oxidoreductase [Pacificimonas sp. WHA3]|uniref:NADH:flavin oxidoreductase n=1 Tax=Pacificimonas pallii TaxID=2827236 RepID=A0ABS6SGV0_9SPHN|nr:NADH:flavin oxidoreductase [Pacificimonas pallii]MBV7257634.1 NADH:flavin oxidoreductase [Pacificimonas pallii]